MGSTTIRSILLLLVLLISIVFGQVTFDVAGFEDSKVADVGEGTCFTFTGDGRIVIGTQDGQIKIYSTEGISTALDISTQICHDVERGILGVVVDPDFASNNYIYVYHTYKKHGVCPTGEVSTLPVNRVSRFTLPSSNVIDVGSAVVILDNILSQYGNHNAGDLHFGSDGLLYVSTGDGGGGQAAKSTQSLSGKILRINKDGTIPASNPLTGDGTAIRCGLPNAAANPAYSYPWEGVPCLEVIAMGLRNPFRFAMKPGSSQFYINDVGYNTIEEINEFTGVVGNNVVHYGWSDWEGLCQTFSPTSCNYPAQFTPPIHYYNHNIGCTAITGGDFVPEGAFPSPLDQKYIFADYNCGKVWYMDTDTKAVTQFATGYGSNSLITIKFGPNIGGIGQALYYTTFYGQYNLQLRKIVSTTSVNRQPVVQFSVSPTYGAAPLEVTLNATETVDPDGDTLTYEFDYGDETPKQNISSQTSQHTYNANGAYYASVTVYDSNGAKAASSEIRIDVGNSPPVPVITSPSIDAVFSVGQTVTLSGSATDPEDGELTGSSLGWSALLHHVNEDNVGAEHVHPLLSATTGATVTFNFPQAEDIKATKLSYVEAKLTATDSNGLAVTISRNIIPSRILLTFIGDPVNSQITVGGFPLTTPVNVTSWANHHLAVAAPTFVDNGYEWNWVSWSDGGENSHSLITPSSNSTVEVLFSQGSPAAPVEPTPPTDTPPHNHNPDGSEPDSAVPSDASINFVSFILIFASLFLNLM